jgi:hypothetical protein
MGGARARVLFDNSPIAQLAQLGFGEPELSQQHLVRVLAEAGRAPPLPPRRRQAPLALGGQPDRRAHERVG